MIVSVPSRGFLGVLTFSFETDKFTSLVSVPSRGLGGSNKIKKLFKKVSSKFPSPLEDFLGG